ncbi:MAG: Ferrous iron transport protein, partial [Gemmatimonadota bacterium]
MPTASVAPTERPGAGIGRVALIGNPNTGKTTLFNALCGARAKTSNFPGTTTAVRRGHSRWDGAGEIEVLDLPGVYDLTLDAPESEIARVALSGRNAPAPDALVVVVDACNLARNLVLTAQVLSSTARTVVALNMCDLARRRGTTIDAAELSRRLGVPVVPIVARTHDGVSALRAALSTSWHAHPSDLPSSDAAAEAIMAWAERVAASVTTGTVDQAADD